MVKRREHCLIGRFARHSHGFTAVEFALIATPLFALVLAIAQTALVFFLEETIQSVADAAARELMTGQAQQANMTAQQFQTYVCGKLPSLFSCSSLMVDVESSSAFNAINTASPTITYGSNGAVSNSWNFTPGTSGQVTIVRVMYEWPIVGGPLGVLLANQPNGTRLLMGTSVLKIEPYSS